MKKISFTAIFFLLSWQYVLAKGDSLAYRKRWTIYTDLILDALNEKNIGVELKFFPKIALGASYGRIKPYQQADISTFIAQHDVDPGRVATGNAFKIFGKFYLTKKRGIFLKLDLMYKKTAYDSVRFYDMHITTSSREGGISFSRNEKTNLFGYSILFGGELNRHNIRIEYLIGMGTRFRFRDFTTYQNSEPNNGYAPLGAYSYRDKFPAIILGLNVGTYYSKKSKN